MDNFKNIQEEDVHKEARDKHEKPEKQVINELLLIQAEQTANVVLIRESVCKEEINRKHESRTLFGGEVDECENNILKAWNILSKDVFFRLIQNQADISPFNFFIIFVFFRLS